MKGGVHFNYEIWKDRFRNKSTYFLFPDGGVSLDDELAIGKELLGEVGSCFLVKTSGSSGVAKWVIHSKRGLLNHARLVNDHLLVNEDDVFGLVLPAYHVGGMGVIARAFVSGAGIVSLGDKWTALGCVEFIKINEVSLLSLVPTQLVDIVGGGYECPASLRVVVVGGGGLDEDIYKGAIRLGWPIQESYGMTETGAQIATGRMANGVGDDAYLRLIDGWEVRNSDEGLLEVKGECLFNGYVLEGGEDIEGAELVDPLVDGWFRTSDRVEIKEGGGEVGLRFMGRSDERVKILGELVNVSELEAVLGDRLGGEVYLIPLDDERRGVRLVPVVVNDLLVREIDDIGWSGLSELEGAVVISEFPRNDMGKLMRQKLVEMLESIVFPSD